MLVALVCVEEVVGPRRRRASNTCDRLFFVCIGSDDVCTQGADVTTDEEVEKQVQHNNNVMDPLLKNKTCWHKSTVFLHGYSKTTIRSSASVFCILMCQRETPTRQQKSALTSVLTLL